MLIIIDNQEILKYFLNLIYCIFFSISVKNPTGKPVGFLVQKKGLEPS
jgi:hypothetical protein